MKKVTMLLSAALVSAALLGGVPTSAQAATTAVPLKAEQSVQLPYFLETGSPFLQKSITLKNGTYQPYTIPLPELPQEDTIPDNMKKLVEQMPIGQLQISHDNLYATATILHWSYPIPKDTSTDPFHSLFAGNKESSDALRAFNQLLYLAEPVGNGMIQSYISASNKKNKTSIPQDILSFTLRNTTQASSFGTHGYTFGSRFIVIADGWTLPFYAKAYVWKKDTRYYLLAASAADSEWDLLLPAMDELAMTGQKEF